MEPNRMTGIWKISADTGGTFTDIVAWSPSGKRMESKVLSTGNLRIRCLEFFENGRISVDARDLPDGFLDGFDLGEGRIVRELREGVLSHSGKAIPQGAYLEVETGLSAPVLGAHRVTETPLQKSLPPMLLRVATTRGTNALLEGKGAKVALVVSDGWKDLLRIGDQTRPDLFLRPIPERRVLFHSVESVAVRFDRQGNGPELSQISEVGLSDAEVAVVSLCNGYLNSKSEVEIAEELEARTGVRAIAASSISSLPGYLRRTETAVVEGYLSPIMDRYLDGIARSEGVDGLEVMTSSGGIVPREQFRAVDSLLSGPAGGMVGAVAAAQRAEIGPFLAFDMGGTSTDVSRFDGDLAYRSELTVGDARIYSEALRIDTVAAGGGSICDFDGFGFTVGPDSAGAEPGPACYGRGGPLTLTDVHLLLGRIDPDRFRFPLDSNAAEEAFTALLEKVGRAEAESDERLRILEGFRSIANERMAGALRGISIRDGMDPENFALLSFGGGGGLHACALADRLGMNRILQPGSAGILSAEGLSLARPERMERRPVMRPLKDFEEDASDCFSDLDRLALDTFEVDPHEALEWKREAFIRLTGQESTLVCEWEEGVDLEESFHRQFEEIFGFRQSDVPLEVASIRVRVRVEEENSSVENFPEGESLERNDGAFLDGDALEVGTHGVGPCVISQRFGTLVVEKGWRFRVGEAGSIRLDRDLSQELSRVDESSVEEVEHELFRNRFAAVVDSMGEMLRRTALSVNIRERLDFSCALLDGEGYLAVNAPHIPVHLGAMGHCVRSVSAALDWRSDDIAVTNHPGFGGSHLPDVTVLAPVFAGSDHPVAFLAVRAHHAEIGGIRAGSMPADAHSLAEEGVVLEPFHLIRKGEDHFGKLRDILSGKTGQPFPSRSPEINHADILSQVAAIREGTRMVEELVEEVGAQKVTHFLARILQQSEAWMRETLSALSQEVFRSKAEVFLDGGECIQVAARRDSEGRVVVDAAGTDSGKGSFQCPIGVSLSAVLYVCRLLVDRDVPLNEGLLRAIEIQIPEGCLLSASFGEKDPDNMPPVVAGNVEVSQRFVEALIRLFQIEADSQGTMNNVIFGNQQFSHYETIAGGSGASMRGPGRSAVQVHMTNTAITDPEILEHRFPVRVESFRIRPSSGGEGANRGGCGVIREYFFEETVELSLLTQHRTHGPEGVDGGGSGAIGRQVLIHPDGKEEILPYGCTVEAIAGSSLRVETPGGGGWGKQG
ncbi:hydantoinase B/oxoprolinase family protein [Puniceicoccus vermicola]